MPVSSRPDLGHPLVARLLARCTFPAGESVSCAVSGGPDSSALLVLAVAGGCRVEAIHVDHGLRDGSGAEALMVARLARSLGASSRSLTVRVPPGANLEARARAARLGVLPTDVLTGHTADDQAETILVNLLRGSATAGLAGMRPGARRPLLALRRTETAELCAALEIPVVDDPTNRDRRFVRNRVRAEILPLLAAAASRDLVPILCRQADLVREDDDLLEGLAATLDPTDARALAAAPRPLAARAIRRWIGGSDPVGYRPDSAAVDRVLDVAAGHVAGCELAGGLRVARTRQRLVLTHAPGPTCG